MARILIVEDEFFNASMMQTLLKDAGHEVGPPVTTAQEATHRVKDDQPDLVLVDIGLSGKTSGLDLARELQSISTTRIFFLTGFSDSETEMKMKALNPAGFLLKPFQFSELKSAIEKALLDKPIAG